MTVYVLFVESVNFCNVGGIAGGGDLLTDDLYGCPVVPGEKKRRPLARKCARHGTADRTSRSVNHRDLVLQQHLWFLSPFVMQTPRHGKSGRADAQIPNRAELQKATCT